MPSHGSKTNGCKRWVVDLELEALAGASTLSLLTMKISLG